MNNEDRLANWRKRKLSGAGSGSSPANPAPEPDSFAPVMSGKVADGRTDRQRELDEAKEAERRKIASLLPSGADLQVRKAEIASQDYVEGKRYLLYLTLTVIIPLVLLAAYLGIIQRHYFSSGATFAIMTVQNPGINPASGLLGVGGGAGLADSFRVKQYLLSAEAMTTLEKERGFLKHFGRDEGLDLSFYRNRIAISVDQQQGFVTLEVDGVTPEDSVAYSHALLDLAKKKVGAISDQINVDQLAVLEENERRAKLQLGKAAHFVQTVQTARSDLDPRKSAESIFSIVNGLETDLAEQEAQRAAILDNGLSDSPLLPRLNARIIALKAQIARQEDRLITAVDGNSAQRSIAAFDAAVGEKQAAEAALQSARSTLEQARLRALEQRAYLVVIAQPIVPTQPQQSRLLIVTLIAIGLLSAYAFTRFFFLRKRVVAHA